MEALSWREKLFMMAIVGSWFLALTLIFADRIHETFKTTTDACGYECRDTLDEIQYLYIYNRDESNSCVSEFQMCLKMIDEATGVE